MSETGYNLSSLDSLVSIYNGLTHFPITVERVRAEIQADVNELKGDAAEKLRRWNVDGCPESVARALALIERARAHLFAESVRERQIAPPWTVTGRANYHGNPDRARRVYERAAERWETAKKVLARALRKYNPNREIRSDEADAIERLKAKIAKLKAFQQIMKDINGTIRKGADMAALGERFKISEQCAYKLLNPRQSYERKGFQGWELTNNQANIRRLEKRLEILEREKVKPETERISVTGAGFECFEDLEWQRVCFRFPGKPDEKTRTALKSCGFKWAPSALLWVRQLNQAARYAAQEVIKELKGPDLAVIFAGTDRGFQAKIEKLAAVWVPSPLSVLEVFAKWREYSKQCQSYDQSALLSEFLSWNKQPEIDYQAGFTDLGAMALMFLVGNLGFALMFLVLAR